RVVFVEALMQHLKSPDYSATIAWAAPLGGTIMQQLKLEDREIEDKTGKLTDTGVLPVDPGYFSTLGVKLLRGRDFQAWDGRNGGEVAIVNERFAAKYWPGEDPIGKRLRLGDKKAPWLSVIGVTPDVFQDGNPVSGPRPV